MLQFKLHESPTSTAISKFISDLAEAKAFIKAFKPEVTDARVEEIFKKYDADNSGTLDKDECRKLATDMKLLG